MSDEASAPATERPDRSEMEKMAPPFRSRWRILWAGIGLPLLFVALATLFAQLLQPIAEKDAPTVARPVATIVAKTPEPTPPESPAPAAPSVQTPVEQPAALPVTPVTPPAPAPYMPSFKGPRIAVMLTELGPNDKAARQAVAALPAAVSFAFSPYADMSKALGQQARADGHELWLSLPMQPRAYPKVSPGANSLLVGSDGAENARRLDWALSRVDRPAGVTNMMGSAFTENAPAFRGLAAALKSRGLVFLDARSSGRSIAEREARAAGVRAATNDRFLDEPADPATIDANLAALEATAKRNGRAIGFARALPVSIERIAAWAQGLEAKGYLLVPVGTLVQD